MVELPTNSKLPHSSSFGECTKKALRGGNGDKDLVLAEGNDGGTGKLTAKNIVGRGSE